MNENEQQLLEHLDRILAIFRKQTGQLIGCTVDFDRGPIIGERFSICGSGRADPLDSENHICGEPIQIR